MIIHRNSQNFMYHVYMYLCIHKPLKNLNFSFSFKLPKFSSGIYHKGTNIFLLGREIIEVNSFLFLIFFFNMSHYDDILQLHFIIIKLDVIPLNCLHIFSVVRIKLQKFVIQVELND